MIAGEALAIDLVGVGLGKEEAVGAGEAQRLELAGEALLEALGAVVLGKVVAGGAEGALGGFGFALDAVVL